MLAILTYAALAFAPIAVLMWAGSLARGSGTRKHGTNETFQMPPGERPGPPPPIGMPTEGSGGKSYLDGYCYGLSHSLDVLENGSWDWRAIAEAHSIISERRSWARALRKTNYGQH